MLGGGKVSGASGDRFTLLRKIGAGGMGVVYRAHDSKRGIEVALKTVSRADGKALYRFKREFRSLADVSHPNLVTLYELHTSADEWFFTMELISGGTFAEYVRPFQYEDPDATISSTGDPAQEDETKATGLWRPLPKGRRRVIEGTLDVPRLIDATAQLVDGIFALHRVGKLHRDLKPTNVLVDREGRVVILDFGLTADKTGMDGDHTHSVAYAVGTPLYMSPEQAADVPLTEASDWYSIGVMLYEALTGHRPFDKRRASAVFLAKQTEAIKPPGQLAGNIPAELEALCVALLQRDPRDRPSAKQILAVLGREPSRASMQLRGVIEQPFVGRAQELAKLESVYRQSRDGGVCVFLRGTSGMGKSMLVRRFVEGIAPTDGAVVLRGRCYEREVVPHKTLDSVVDSLTRVLLDLPDDVVEALTPRDIDALAKVFPVIKRVGSLTGLSLGGSEPPDPQEMRRRAFGALRYILTRLAQRGPVVLYIDDVQWGDPDSAGFLRDLWQRHDSPAVMLIASFRSEDMDTSPTLAMLREPGDDLVSQRVHEIVLDAFETSEVLALVEAVRPGRAEKTQIERLLSESEGTPMFVAELVRRLGSDDEPQQGEFTLARLLAERVAALRDEERALLEVCCVAGRPLPPAIIVAAARQNGEGRALTVLRRERLTRVRDNERETIEPFHDQIRAVVTDGLDEATRRDIHRRLALAMEMDRTPDAVSQVDHWLEAGENERAAEAALRAAKVAENMLAFHLAADFFALVLQHKPMSDDDRRQVLARRGYALMHAGQLDEAAEAFHDAGVGAPHEELLEYARLELEQILRRGHLERGLERANAVLREVGRALPGSRFTALVSILTNRARLRISGMRYRTRSDDELDHERLLRLDVEWSVASAIAFVSPIQGRALQMQFMREALSTGSPKRVAQAFCLELGYLGIFGAKHREKCEQLRLRALEITEELGDDQLRGSIEGASGVSSFLFGRWKESSERCASGEQFLRDNAANARWEIDITQTYRTAAMAYMGRFRELSQLLPIFIREAQERGDVYAARALEAGRANLLWLALDQPEESLRHVDAVAVGTDEFHLHHYYQMLVRANIELYRGQATQAHERLVRQWPALERTQLLRIQIVRVEAWFLRGRCAMACAVKLEDGSKRHALLTQVERAVARMQKDKLPWAHGLAQLLKASVCHVRGDREGQLKALRRAIDACDATDMNTMAAIGRLRYGTALANREGATTAANAIAALEAEAIVAPMKFAALFAPAADDAVD